ncbi:hypothetical protein S40288_10597 [Stachybotrys chartarum IBT 40288]|nr:hypothetical protein S40288_10597 [Stachybotrys chartarum IBT 40288]
MIRRAVRSFTFSTTKKKCALRLPVSEASRHPWYPRVREQSQPQPPSYPPPTPLIPLDSALLSSA